MNQLNKKERLNDLLAFYEKLLTDKQIDIMTLYFKEDYSLNEIAELKGISRNAVHDLISRCEITLEAYDSKLELISKYKERAMIYEDLLKCTDESVTILVNKCIESE